LNENTCSYTAQQTYTAEQCYDILMACLKTGKGWGYIEGVPEATGSSDEETEVCATGFAVIII